MTIVKHELKRNWKSLLIWSAILGGMIFMFMLMFPAIKDQIGAMQEAYANMGSFTAMFGMDKINFTTAMGFYGIEAGAMISLGGAMFAALTGAGALSKEEGNHTAEFLLTHPISRKQIVAEKLIFVALQVLCFNLFCFVCALISFGIINEPLEMNKLLLFHFVQLIMQWEIACICLCVSAFQKKANVGLGLGFSAILYFMNLFVNASEDAKFLKYITPFNYSDASEVFSTGHLDGVLIGIGCAIAVAGVVVAFVKYCKKDINA